MKTSIIMGLGVSMLVASVAGASEPAPPPIVGITMQDSGDTLVKGPDGWLAGSFLDAPAGAPAVLIIPGSGPTDRNGDNPLGVKGGVYRQLAEGLQARGIATLRTDKRGIGGSAKASADPNKVTIEDYVGDTRKWVDFLHAHHPCVWLAGHSEGGLIALAAAQRIEVCGIVLIAAPGRPLDTMLHEQLGASLPADMMAATDRAIAELKAGRTVDPAAVPEPVRPIFNPATQGYLSDMMRADPAALVSKVKVPVLIVQGSEDLQVKPADAAALAKAQPRAKLAPIEGMNHVFRTVPKGDRAANLQSYGAADQPIAPALVDVVANFIKQPR